MMQATSADSLVPSACTAPIGDTDVTAGAALELRELQRNLLRSIAAEAPKQSILSTLAAILTESINPVAIRYYHRDSQKQLSLAWQHLPGGGQTLPESLHPAILNGCHAACTKGHLETVPLIGHSGFFVACVPVFLRHQPPEALALVLPTTTRSVDRAIVILQLVATHITLWQLLGEADQSESEARATAALLEMIGKLQSSDDLQACCFTLVSVLKDYLRCDQVAVGICRGHKQLCSLVAISAQARIDQHSDLSRAFEAGFDEAVLRGGLAEWPVPAEADAHATRAQQRLCSLTGSRTSISAPLEDEQGRTVGAWVFLGDADFQRRRRDVQWIEAALRPVGSCLRLKQQAEVSRWARSARAIWHRRSTWQAKAAVATAIYLAALLCLPRPYTIHTDCQIQPVTRRFVVAPFDGRLETAVVSPGDVVSQDAVLARMDGRDVRWELTGLVAELGRSAKRRDAAMASHDVVTAQLAKLDMERLEANIQMLERRAQNLDVKSPIDGIVVSGDLERAEGAPLTKGQTLFEVAPLDKMIVEIAIPDREIAYVRPGREVTIRLDAYPGQTWSSTLDRIHPRSENKDGRNVFIGEVQLQNSSQLLRPGMDGSARVISELHPLGWNLFHKAWEAALEIFGL
jgi:multidrug resistance efflux pump